MKLYSLTLFTLLTLASCKDKADDLIIKEKVKLYIIASTGAYTGTPPPSMQISGTHIETVTGATGTHIIEVNYPKGETQTVSLKGNQADTELYLEVSKGVSLNVTDRVAYKMGNGTVSVSFVAP
ncbi:MAG: hypothetical protein ACO1N7_06470 [Sphingobacteriaceae bacterium]